uniref:Uncharacterized mitochondrial protein AtMg00810-like n=1 Tax=Tanacetum cinerariifolium TaxID=118510 RepID=A0A6L2KZ39_TANCI|nr:uncharacterized mitochondrial protein AtMg00810-like [Tanacetum cinerariifolium]
MATTKLDVDLQGTQVDQTKYQRMIEGLMYLIASRPDIAFVTFVCARYQARPTEEHLKEVKWIFRYLRQTINMGLWYSKDSGFERIAYSDVDHVGCNDDCKNTSGGIQFLRDKLVSWSSKKQDCTAMSTAKDEYLSLSARCAQYSSWINKSFQLLKPSSNFKTLGDFLFVYLQQFLNTANEVPFTKDTIIFKLDSQEIIYTMDIFRSTLQLSVETPTNPFIAPATIRVIELFMQKVGYQSVVDKVKYKMVFVKVVVPMIQLQPVVSTQRTHMTTPSTHMSHILTAASPQKKKRKQIAGETSSSRKSLKVTIKQKQLKNTPIPPLRDDKERDEITEATFLSLTLHKITIAAKVQEKLEDEEINKMVKGEEDEESYASEFSNSMLNDENDDSNTRIEPGSHKKNPKKVDDDDDETEKEKKDDKKNDDAEDKDNDDHTDHALVGSQETGSMETRKEKIKCNHISGVIHRICKRQEKATNDLIEGNLKRVMANTIIQEHDALQAEAPALVLKELANQAPQIIEELFKSYVMMLSVHNIMMTIMKMMLLLRGRKRQKDKRLQRVQKAQSLNLNEPPRYLYNKDIFLLKYGNTEERSYILSLHKIHADPFLKEDLEERLKRCVRKEFMTFNEEARLSIHHWKDSWHKRMYKLNQRSVRDNPEEYFSNTRKEEKRGMYLAEIIKFCYATLERVLKEVKLKIFKSEPQKKPPLRLRHR